MPMIEWNESFTIGVDPFDEHHKHLVHLLNTSYDAFVLGVPTGKLADILNELFEYASYHFASEQFWMLDHSYPTLEQHLEEHSFFVQRLKEIQEDFRQGNSSVSLDIVIFLKNWLIDHILKSDVAYAKFISTQENVSSQG
jgi:hemerythrin